MIPINQAYNTVMMLLDKNSKGMIEPTKFNLFCDLAQNDILEQLFYDYNNWLNKLNKRLSGSENADIPKIILEQIDTFSEYTTSENFTYNQIQDLWSYLGNDFYRMINLSLVNAQGKKTDIELVTKSELNILINSTMNTPTYTFPVYCNIGGKYRVFPKIQESYSCEMAYLRKPKQPKWTYIESNGNPLFNPSAQDKQDIELSFSLYSKFIIKVMSYCGLSIREADVVQVMNQEEIKETQKQS